MSIKKNREKSINSTCVCIQKYLNPYTYKLKKESHLNWDGQDFLEHINLGEL